MIPQALKERIESELLEGLNPVQREAVLHDRGPLLIVAGAGSGKTRVITHRIAYLVRLRDVRAYNVAAVTFTNKAAQEMRERLSQLMGPLGSEVFVRTFHSLGLHILSRNAEAAGLRSGFSVIDTSGQNTVLKAILKEWRIEGDGISPAAIAHRINQARDALVGPAEYAREADDFYTRAVARVYPEYIKRLRAINAVDFGDLLFETVSLLESNSEVLEKYQRLWQYFMIDEYQDTNHAQYMLGRLIARNHENIMVVGDDDQSIYSWRGANIANILEFEKDYGSAKVLRLEENYRSTARILSAANSVIKNNEQRRAKTLFTTREEGAHLEYQAFPDDESEARSVVSRLQSLRSRGYSYADMAVFYRTNAQSRVFESALREAGVPYLLVGDIRFYERKEIKDLLAYLQVIVNPADDLSLERIINVPPRGLGNVGLDRLRNHAIQKGQPLASILEAADQVPNLRGYRKVQTLGQLLEEWSAAARLGSAPSELAESVLDRTGYLQMLRADTSPDAPGRIDNLYELIGSMRSFEEERASRGPEARADLAEFLQTVSLETSVEGEASEPGVFLMTLHNAKGLEYPIVFLTGFEEGYLPHSLSVDEGNTEEERRLLYVGITRARDQLFLSACRRRRVFGSYQDRLPSRFLEELEPGVFSNPPVRGSGAPRAAAGMGRIAWKEEARPENYRAGERVRHARYGPGTIRTVENTVAGQKLAIAFDSDEERNERAFLARYTPLERETGS
ncbi:MAG: UvrD-helicase domain-containing protein [Spirochaetales bacterium]|nr:UvrD-helicase domain-containing protein [Leptospiraceae bacterium]MCP5480709.1 UvrD-helicase domain-containing protein [Spirochaetales bacterium]MCP5484061.1 UvrD-helicase domain-containing protein [Spirochaetales bacterium]